MNNKLSAHSTPRCTRRPRQVLSLAALSTALCALLAHQSLAADLPANASITKVEVFQHGATITRSASVAIPAGQHRLVFSDLPSTIDPSLIRVVVNSRSVRFGSVNAEKVTEAEFIAAKERQLRTDIEKLE